MTPGFRLRKKILFGVAGLLLLNAAAGLFLSWRMTRQVNAYLPPGAEVARAGWSPPFGVALDKVSIPDPAGKNPFLLRADRVVLQIPWWGLLTRPVPAKVTLLRPHLKVGSENVEQLLGGIDTDLNVWLRTPFPGIDREKEDPVFRKMPFIPFGIKVVNGRMDAMEEETRAGEPVFIADPVDLSLELTAVSMEPVVHLAGRGDFVTGTGEIIGRQEAEVRYRPRKQAIEGSLRLRHERLGDFRNLYQYAPRPIFIEGGIADFSLQFALTGGNHVRMTAHCLVQNLDLNGKVGEVSWADIMHAVEDENRIYEWTVPVEGDLSDPGFNPHDTVLSEVEWKMKEKAAARGLKIPDQMFFYADSPDPEGEEAP